MYLYMANKEREKEKGGCNYGCVSRKEAGRLQFLRQQNKAWSLVILEFYYAMMHTVIYNVQFVVLFFILLWDSAKYFANKQNRLIMLCAEALAYEF